MKETDLQKEIACKFVAAGYGKLFINDNGLGFRKDGIGFKYGLGKGTSDLIGFTIVNGKAVFTALEVKLEGTYPTKEQKAFIEIVKASGGIAGIVRSWEDVEELIKKPTD